MEKKTVMVVDDSTSILMGIKKILEKENFNVLTAVTGEYALGLLQTEHPDIILLDLMLPGINGFEILKTLKEKNIAQDIPKIVISSRTEPEDIVNALTLGAIDYMTKPLDLSELIARINAGLNFYSKKLSHTSTDSSIFSQKIEALEAFGKKFNSFVKAAKKNKMLDETIINELTEFDNEFKRIIKDLK